MRRVRGLLSTLLSSAAVAALILSPGQVAAQSTWQGTTSDYNTNSNWNNSTAPISSGQSAIFGNTGSTSVNVSSAVSPDGWTFNSSSQSYTVTGSAVTISTATGIVDSAIGQVISIGNNLGGVGGLANHDTTGTLTLTGNNSYNGATTVDSGAKLIAGSAAAFSASSDFTVNGTLDLGGFSNSVGSLSGSGIVTNTGGSIATLTVGGNNATTTFSGTLQDGVHPLALTVAGTGTIILTGNNSYQGGTTISAGTLQLGDGSIGGIGKVGSGNVVNNGTLAANLGLVSTVLLDNVISGSGALTKTGVGTLILGGNNTYSGTTTINGGTITVGNSTSGTLGSGDVVNNGALAFNRSNTITLANNVSGTGGITDNGFGLLILTGTNTYSGQTISNGGSIQVGAGGTTGSLGTGDVVLGGLANLTFSRSNFTTIANNISGNGSVTFQQSGGYAVTGTNTYTGGTIISAGVLQIGLGGTTGSIAGNVTDNATLAFNRGDDITFAGNITGGGGIQVGGGGFTNLTGTNTYTGSNLVFGKLGISNDANIGPANVQLMNGTLAFNASGTITHNVVLSSGGSLDTRGNTVTLSGILSTTTGSNTSLTKQSAGTLILTGANTYDGLTTTISAGTLQIGNGGTTGQLNGLQIVNNSVLAYSRSDTISGAQISGTGSVVQLGSGILILGNNNTYSGGTIISGGTVQISSPFNLGSGTVTDNGTLAITTNGSFTIANAIAGTGAVTLTTTGAGSVTLGGNNSYSGGTIIGSGSAMLIGGNTAFGSGTITNNGILALGSSTSVTLSNNILGGGVVNLATGTLILTGSNSYAGGTNISNGATLQIGNGGISGTLGSGAVTNNGTLAYNLSTATNLATTLSGAGGLSQLGAGTLTLISAQPYGGTTSIAAGSTLALSGSGSIASSSVNDAGTFDISAITAASTTIKALTGAGTVNLGSKGLIISAGSGTFSGNFAGSGALELSGGTTILGSTITNNVTVDTGAVLQIGAGGASGAVTGNITDNGNVTFNRMDSVTYTGIISGSGSLTQSGSGTLILTGANAYSGPTLINSGTLQVGNGGTTGSLGSGTISDNGTLTFNRSDSIAIANIVLGNGNLVQSGTGTLILTGSNSYSGTTTISSGTLQVGNGGTTGSFGAGNITNNSILAFNRSDSITYTGVISGTGSLMQSGSGKLILTGTSTYTGPTTINSGTLSVNGSIASSAVTVNSGGKLGGTGTTGAVTVANGGQIAPGNSIGTITVSSLTLNSGSTTTMELSTAANDRINVTGAATLGGTLALVPAAGAYTATSYRLIQAGSITGTFASVTGQVGGLNNTVQYSATAVDLILTPVVAPPTTFLFGTYGATANQIAAGNALTAGSPAGLLYTAMGTLVTGNIAAVPAALGQLAGDIHPSLRAAAIEDSRIIRDTLLTHMTRESEGTAIWAAGFGGYGGISGNGNAAALHHDNAGFLAGVDFAATPELRLGVEAGYSSNTAHTQGRFSVADGDLGHVGAYADWHNGPLNLALGGDYGFGTVRTSRTVTALAMTSASSHDQKTGQIFGDLGYQLPLEGALIEPHATLAHVSAVSGAFTESGSAAALSGAEKSDSQSYAILGLRASFLDWKLDETEILPRVDAGWQHALTHLVPGQTSLLQDPNQSFLVLGTPLARDAVVLQAGFDMRLGPATLFISYDGGFASTTDNHAFRGGLNWQF
jgi:autotransporter-associated beta strand protein